MRHIHALLVEKGRKRLVEKGLLGRKRLNKSQQSLAEPGDDLVLNKLTN